MKQYLGVLLVASALSGSSAFAEGSGAVSLRSVDNKGLVSVARPASEDKAAAALIRRDQEYRDFFVKMDEKHNKIARAVKEYVDPKTSANKRIKIKTYLRQTPVKDPEDKLLLKAVSVDPQYRELASELDLALLHAIQDNPEDSDEEYILERFERNLPLGWLLYATLNVWDPRYVPFLVEAATMGDFYCIEILGRAKVKEAVPVLETALNHKNDEVRKAAYYALRSITGKQYDYKPAP